MKSNRWEGLGFDIGARVRATNPDDYLADTARKLRNREGVVTGHQHFYGAPIVTFPAVGRRKVFKWVPGDPRNITLIEDNNE